ncbi:MAG: restriction endonuclease subunit S [Candidatus Methanosuratincola sp.]
MVSEYPLTRLGSVAEIIMGQSPPGSTYNENGNGLPFYQGVVDFGTRYPTPRVYCSEPTRIAEPGDILFSVRAPIGRINIASERCCIGRGLAAIRLKHSQDRTFVEYALKGMSNQWDIFEEGGSVFGNARKEDLQSLEIIWPAPEIRRAIAHILGTLDDKIELNRRMNQTLDAMAQALFKSWFVDFEPFRDQGMQDSPLGPIPVGWRVGKLQEIAVLHRESISPPDYPDETFDHYSIPAFDEGRTPKAETGNEIKSNKFQIPNGAVLISKLNPRFPRVWLPFDNEGRRSICSTEFLVVTPKRSSGREYLYSLFCSDGFLATFSTLVTGTSSSHQRVRPEDLMSIDLVIPTEDVIDSYSHKISPILSLANHNLSESNTLAEIRDALLPKLLSGELGVKDAEKFVEKVL